MSPEIPVVLELHTPDHSAVNAGKALNECVMSS